MSATYSAFTRPAAFAGQDRMKRMPSSMHCTCMAATPNLTTLRTGVMASVSLFALVPTYSVATRLLVSLVVIISLILISLTGLRGLVGLTIGLKPNVLRGD